MVNVSRSWIKENVKYLYGCYGLIRLEDIDEIEVPKGGYPTNLTKAEKQKVEKGEGIELFVICLPGWCWAAAFSYSDADGKQDDFIW
ncbi:MAG TPA: hypothetical protein GXX65_07260 [Methanosarcina sp.]|nr:hypothetical protein [Methanosarcina sp.]